MRGDVALRMSIRSAVGPGPGSKGWGRVSPVGPAWRPPSGSMRILAPRGRSRHWHSATVGDRGGSRAVGALSGAPRLRSVGGVWEVPVPLASGQVQLVCPSSRGGEKLEPATRCPCRGSALDILGTVPSGSNSVGRVSASQAECRGFESRLPLQLPPFRPQAGCRCTRGSSGSTQLDKVRVQPWMARSEGRNGAGDILLAAQLSGTRHSA